MFSLLRNLDNRNSIILVLLFFFTEFLGWKYIGPISLRNLGIIIMACFLFFNRKHVIDKEVLCIIKVLAGYYIFVAVLGFVNGLYENVGFTLVFARFLPSIMIIIFMLKYVNSYLCFRYVLVGIIFLLLFDSIATVLQGINHPIGWAIAQYFEDFETVQSEMDNMEAHNATSSIGLSIASGFYSTVVGNGYFLGSFGMLYIMPLIWRPSKLNAFFSLSIFVVCLMALFYCQQRMAFYVYILGALSAYVYYMILSRQQLKIVFVIVGLVFAILLGMFDTASDIEAGRLLNLQDEAREAKHALFWEDFLPNNLFLGNRTLFVKMYHQTPHSMFIETLLYGGIFGLTIYSVFLLKLAKLILRYSFKRENIEITMLCMPIVAFVAISLQHSSGLHTGMTLGVYALGLFFLSLRLCRP